METPRCEPPPEWRDRDGWHWVQQGNFAPTLAHWHPSNRVWTSAEHVYSATPVYAVREWGWHYIAPAAEVEALRARILFLEGECNSMNNDLGNLERDNAALRAGNEEMRTRLMAADAALTSIGNNPATSDAVAMEIVDALLALGDTTASITQDENVALRARVAELEEANKLLREDLALFHAAERLRRAGW